MPLVSDHLRSAVKTKTAPWRGFCCLDSEAGIRTPIRGTKNLCPAVERPRNVVLILVLSRLLLYCNHFRSVCCECHGAVTCSIILNLFDAPDNEIEASNFD